MNEKCKKALDILEKVVDYREDYHISYTVACEEWDAIETIRKQLQAYKDKEDKLRNVITKLSKDEHIELFANEYVRSCLDDFLDILSKGSDE